MTTIELVPQIEPLDQRAMGLAQQRLDRLTKPAGSLGRLEDVVKHLAGITGSALPAIRQPVILTLAADHGVVAEGVSAYPSTVTAQMVLNFLRGGAAVNVLARQAGARVVVVDMGVAVELPPHPALVARKFARGTKNFLREPAMTREEASAAIRVGLELAEREVSAGADLLGTGDMGIGNTTASSAITAAMTGAAVHLVTGRGTGIDDATLKEKISVIERALQLHRPDAGDPLDVLAKVGGLEIAGLVGVILGGARARKPVVIDGFIAGAAALIAVGLAPGARDYLIASHRSQEFGHRVALQHLRLEPLVDLQLRLGEGTGVALAIPLLRAACHMLSEMATFDEAGVDNKLA